MKIYCTGCSKDVDARLTNGEEIYPHRKDLFSLPFYKCDDCTNYVGCHHKSDNPTRPLGVIPTREIMDARKHLHAILDPLWKNGRIGRNHLYSEISKQIGYPYHNGDIRSVEEARKIYKVIAGISNKLNKPECNVCGIEVTFNLDIYEITGMCGTCSTGEARLNYEED